MNRLKADEEQVSIRFSDVIKSNGIFWVDSWWWLAVGTEVPCSEGDMTRRRVQRCRAAVLHCLLMLAVYGASVATVVVLGLAVYSFW